MSVFTNPATGAAEHATAYVAAVLDLVGDRDPLAVMRETIEVLPHAMGGLSLPQLRQPEQPGKWSIAQVLQHLADSELVGASRFRLILAQDRPQLTGSDQDQWAARLRYVDADPAAALELFTPDSRLPTLPLDILCEPLYAHLECLPRTESNCCRARSTC